MDSITIKKGQPIIIPLTFKKKVIVSNVIDKQKLNELSSVIKETENVTIINPERS